MGLAVSFLYAIGSVVCHQRPERSFFWDGVQLPVCARCTGLYVGGAVALFAWWAARFTGHMPGRLLTPPRARRVIVLTAIPTAVSWTAGALGIWDGGNVTRACLALPLGLAVGVIVGAVSTKDLR
jgi:uncharacterized membrane protein